MHYKINPSWTNKDVLPFMACSQDSLRSFSEICKKITNVEELVDGDGGNLLHCAVKAKAVDCLRNMLSQPKFLQLLTKKDKNDMLPSSFCAYGSLVSNIIEEYLPEALQQKESILQKEAETAVVLFMQNEQVPPAMII